MVNQKFEVQVQGLFWAGLVITPINMRVFRFSSVLILKWTVKQHEHLTSGQEILPKLEISVQQRITKEWTKLWYGNL